MRYFLELSYNGARYKGWQRQPDAPSVQQTLEEALSVLLRGEIVTVGAGRTDTGVHAAYYVAHFDAEVPMADGGTGLLYHLNAILPPDIAVRGIARVADDAHARYDAREREYTYYIVPFKDPFREGTAWYYSTPLDVEAMNEAAAHLTAESDFTSFAKLGGGNRTNLCRVTVARWDVTQDGCVRFTIRADRFLRNMVRAIVGTLVDVGRGKITPQGFAAILAARDLSLSSGSAPAGGLFLTDIQYSNLKQ